MKEKSYFISEVQNENRFILNINFEAKTSPSEGVPNHSSKEASSFYVISGGREDCGENYVVERDAFPYPSIEFVASGTGVLHHSGQEVPLKPGSCFFYNESMPHKIRAKKDSNMRKYFLNFGGTFANEFIHQNFRHSPPILHCQETFSLVQSFEELINYAKDPRPLGQDLCLETAKMILRKVGYYSSETSNSFSTSYQRFLESHQMIQRQYLELNTLNEIAAKCHLHPIYLCRLYKKYSHQTPYQYLMQCKMNHAIRLLESPTGMVKNIAVELGFSDPANFSRAFKKVLGVPPNAFKVKKDDTNA